MDSNIVLKEGDRVQVMFDVAATIDVLRDMIENIPVLKAERDAFNAPLLEAHREARRKMIKAILDGNIVEKFNEMCRKENIAALTEKNKTEIKYIKKFSMPFTSSRQDKINDCIKLFNENIEVVKSTCFTTYDESNKQFEYKILNIDVFKNFSFCDYVNKYTDIDWVDKEISLEFVVDTERQLRNTIRRLQCVSGDSIPSNFINQSDLEYKYETKKTT